MEINSLLNLQVIKKIDSEGVNSTLYIVRDTQLDSDFILKRIDKTTFKIRDTYFNESKKIYSLRHDNIIDIKYTTYDDEYIYIVMPYMKNGSIYNKMKKRNLTIREIIKYSLDFLSAIYYIHQNNVIHCDIKPNNILIDDNDRAIVADFGSAQDLDKMGMARLKNVYYKHIAPEQCKNTRINHKVDIYQIGTTLYRMCNGNHEYNNQVKRYENINELKIACSKGKFPTRNKYMPHVPRKMIEIIEKCIDVNPNNRYDDVLDIINDISKIDDNLDLRYEVLNKNLYRWTLEDNFFIVMKKQNDLWKIKSENYITKEKLDIIVETKAKGYMKVRNIIKIQKK